MKKILKFLCFIIVIYFLSIETGEARLKNIGTCNGKDAIVQYGHSSNYVENQIPWMRRNETENSVFCIEKSVAAPTYGTNGDYSCLLCNKSTTLNSDSIKNKKFRVAIGYLISKYDGTKISYLRTQALIHYFLSQYNNGQEMKNSKTLSDDEYYKNAIMDYDLYSSGYNISLSSSTISLSLKDGNYIGSVTFSGTASYGSHSLLINGVDGSSYATRNKNTINISIPVSVFTNQSNSVSLTVISAPKTFYLAKFKECATNRQKIAEETTTTEEKQPSATASGTITISGKLQINKKDTNGVGITTISNNGPYFNLYKTKTNCENKTSAKYENLKTGLNEGISSGTYYLREIKAKTGYYTPSKNGDSGYCEQVVINAGQTTSINLVNKKSCETSFNANMTMKERIDLYWQIIRDWGYGYDYRALLNMSNITLSDACKPLNESRKYKTTCLGATASTTFNDENISNYNEQYGYYTFCSTTFTLENRLGTSDFGIIKSGRPIIRTDNVVAKGTLNRVCYNYGDATTTIIPLSYSNYITKEPILGGQLLIEGSEIDNRGLLNQTITKDYTLPQMYSHNIDGKVYYNSCPYGNQCKDLGYGIISKFNENPEEKELNFTIKLKEDIFGELSTSTSCKYRIENELIDNKNNVNLEFRSVKTGITNSFFSKTGSGTRKIGANWSNEKIRKQVLELNNNSYNKNNEEPKYLITLTPSIIEEIRLYNKSYKYDDYDFLCNPDGTICSSEYLNKLKIKYDIKNDLTDGWKIDSTKRTCILNPTPSGC